MTSSLVLWASFIISLGVLLWFCRPRQSSLLIWLLIAVWQFPVSFLPLGKPDFRTPPPAKYSVLGVRIDVEKAIYVMLGSGQGEPHLYVLPYSVGKANQLQAAMDAAEAQQGVPHADFDAEGEPSFHAPPVEPDAPKIPERPQYEVQ